MPLQPLQDAILHLSHRYGGDPAFVLAGGGNTSFKSAETLWVKGSGHALATIGLDGFVELDRAKLDAMLAGDWPSDATAREALFLERVMASRLQPEKGQRPSVEALLHHLMPEPLVVHTHPGLVNAVTCCIDGERLTREWFGDEVLWQPYVDPGLLLAQALQASVKEYESKHGKRPGAIFLQNHGLIVAGQTAEAIEAMSKGIVETIHRQLLSKSAETIAPQGGDGLTKLADVIRALRPSLSTGMGVSEGLTWLASTDAGKAAAMAGPLTPDQIVYCRSVPLWIEPGDDQSLLKQFVEAWQAYEAKYHVEPWLAILAGKGAVAFRDSAKMAQTTVDVYADAATVSRNAHRLGGVHPMEARHRQFIEQWEVEAYRRSVAAKS